jgi:hypothetical protein
VYESAKITNMLSVSFLLRARMQTTAGDSTIVYMPTYAVLLSRGINPQYSFFAEYPVEFIHLILMNMDQHPTQDT